MNEIKEAIVLAAGRSRRMEHLSNREPKCFMNILFVTDTDIFPQSGGISRVG
jgi:molybdopterin-guanine dinucleotide biosynthesis protein A